MLDDVLRGVGIKPHPEPNPRDVQLLAEATETHAALRASLDAALAGDGLSEKQRRLLASARAIVADQAQAITGSPSNSPAVGDISFASVVGLADSTADDCAKASLQAVSPAVAQVLAAMAAGLDQLVVAGRRVL